MSILKQRGRILGTPKYDKCRLVHMTYNDACEVVTSQPDSVVVVLGIRLDLRLLLYGAVVLHTLHTVSFDWFLSGSEWILNLEFCYKNFWYFTRHYCGISDLGLTLPHFEFLSLYLNMFDQNLHFLCKKLQFWSNISKFRVKKPKCGRVKSRSDIP